MTTQGPADHKVDDKEASVRTTTSACMYLAREVHDMTISVARWR